MAKKPRRTSPRPTRTTRRGTPPKLRAMDYAAKFDWPGYFRAVEGTPPRETLVKALSKFDEEDARAKASARRLPGRVAIDIGCGEGRDTRAMLRHTATRPWSLLVTDGSANGIEILLDSLKPVEHRRVCAAQCTMQSLPRLYRTRVPIGMDERWMEQVDLVNASFSLPFCPAPELPRLWKWIASRIRPGGRFCGQFFGDRDTWAHVRKTTGVSRSAIDRMFRDFVFEELREEEKDDRTTMGELKHWHVFHIVARKRQ